MSCELSELWMMDALDGTLSASDRQKLRTHLNTCPPCRVEWEALNAVEQMLANPPMVFPAPGFTGRVEARLIRYEVQRRTLIGGLLLLGAALALCLAALPSLLNGRNPIEAYGAFLRGAYELLGYGLLLGSKLFSVLRLTLEAFANSMDVPVLNLLTYAACAVLAIVAWRRTQTSQGKTTSTVRNGH